ncbi:glycoside hydrolase family 88 protein [Mycena belliarum]|uniref:Glycoside hydrolase family 88 protein n=1 Tax=Mycena belliarum TaxID=1033014 RepID=A0AAD6U755_9AGAR|nr:glycoside hydrolase family 88 protein [Mycena belliae]
MYTPICLLSAFALASAQTVPAQLFSRLIPQKVLATAKSLPVPIQYPQYTDTSHGNWIDFDPDTWTSGFFPATLYALNTRKALCGATPSNGLSAGDWLNLGRAASNGLIPLEAHNNQGHDVGFLSFPFVEELAINPSNQTALDAVHNFAADLAARFDPVVGCTRSWGTADPTDFTVIIDNMMNLEILWVVYGLTGNETLRHIALTHADTTIRNHIRQDGSTWHVVEYNSTTGHVIRKRTAQGFSDSSTWSRGQAWAVYGFANMYKRSGDPKYLDTARRLATYFLNNMPSDGIVPWDFNAPLIPAPRPADSSAATIVANGLLLLGKVDPSPAAGKKWIKAAISLLNNITKLAWRPSWQSLLSNGTVNWPANNFLTGIVYGDYYYIKAGNDLVSMGLAKCS